MGSQILTTIQVVNRVNVIKDITVILLGCSLRVKQMDYVVLRATREDTAGKMMQFLKAGMFLGKIRTVPNVQLANIRTKRASRHAFNAP